MHANPTPKDVSTALSAVADDLRALGVRHIFVFGSVARGEAYVNFDVDLAVDAPKPAPGEFAVVGYFDELKRCLRRALRRDVDVVLLPAERPAMKKIMTHEAVRVFDA